MALFQDEPGAARIEALIKQAQEGSAELHLTVVNLGEVVYGMEKRRDFTAALRALGAIDAAPLEIVDVDRPLALQAARLKASAGLGYLDCFVAALAQRLGAAVVTGDPDFQQVEGLVPIEWLPAAEPQ